MDVESWVQNQYLTRHRSESKILLGQKRGIMKVEDTSDSPQKRVKIRDLESVIRSEAQAERGSKTAHAGVNSDARALDLNVNVGSDSTQIGDDVPTSIDESSKLPTFGKEEVQHNGGLTKVKRLDLDLNVEDISSSINDPFYPYKNCQHLKSRDDSECGSSIGLLDEKDLMRVWKGLKQNNYMSAPYGAVPVPIPRPRGRRKFDNDVMKRKIELAKKEQVDRLARVGAPSGLLNGLNPGIINHVRNSKQVHSIIEALVKSERAENQLSGSKKCNQVKCGSQESTERKGQEDVHGLGVDTCGLSHEDSISKRQQMGNYTFFSKSICANEVARGDSDSHKGHLKAFSKMPSQCNIGREDDKLALKLYSSVAVASENTSCLSNDESANLGSVTSLSIKAANVASQWLELLNQDIRGRLAALRRSKKRVRTVITTELPLLISREFSSYSEKDSYTTEGRNVPHLDQPTAEAHSIRWSTLIAQMDKALAEEESHLESWLNQVKEMQLHCEKDLYKNNLCHASLQTGPAGGGSRSGAADNLEKDLSVRAAAASIYSTCNFLLSTENQPCC